jgi:hypothetical protein
LLPETLDGIGFLLLLPFLIVDLVVASNLMSMMSAGSRETRSANARNANVQQHAGSESDKGGTDQAGDRFRGGHLCSVTDAPPGL